MDIKEFQPLSSLLKDIVENESALSSDQCKCLSKYLKELEARSVVIEPDYTDAGYLLDYSNYYSRCHEEFIKVTHRVHFFSCPVADLNRMCDEALADPAREDDHLINAHYLGFVVIKPLPMTIIGRTCLKTYPGYDEKSRRTRSFPILREYHVSLHGISLSIRSIAFQEQDAEIAACSTASIWYALHGLPKKITTPEIPAPFEITSGASATYMKRSLGEVSRKFPTSGLGLEQIEAYFRTHGLDCIVCGVALDKNSAQLCEYVAAYVSAGWPIILVGNLYTGRRRSTDFVKRGLHAVTALGYAEDPHFGAGNSANRIRRIFAHDDNLGPFTSFHIEQCRAGDFVRVIKGENLGTPSVQSNVQAAIEGVMGTPFSSVEKALTGFLSNNSGLAGEGTTARKFAPEYLIIPINHKIRFPYESVSLFANQVAKTYETRGGVWYAPGTTPPLISWSIRLLEVSQYRSQLRGCTTISRDEVVDALYGSMPRYTWQLRFTTSIEATEVTLMDFLFDATALRQSGGLYGMVSHQVGGKDHVFFSIVSALLMAYKEDQIQEVELEIQPIIRTARDILEAEIRYARQFDGDPAD